MKKTVYLMRHGQTLFNQQQRIQGWCDSPLTEKGRQQALAVREYFQREQLTFDGLYCSTQERASDTLELATGSTDYTRLKALKEMSFGVFEGAPEYLHIHRPEGAPSFEDVYVEYGGEDIRDVGKRVHEALTHIVQNNDGERFLVVSHGAAMWGFFLGLELAPQPTVNFTNCCIMQLEYDGESFHFVQMLHPIE